MRYRRLGNSGLKVSEIALGGWRTFGDYVDPDATEACMKAAYDAGCNYFDGAEGYASGRSDQAIGEVLKRQGWRRDTYILAGKVRFGGDLPTQYSLCRKHLVDCCNLTLERFGVEYVDLYFCHRPDPDTPHEEIVRAMQDLITQGKVCYWGTSMFDPGEIASLTAVARQLGCTPPLMEQSRYNIMDRGRQEAELAPLCERLGLGVTAFSPLDVGFLTGRFRSMADFKNRPDFLADRFGEAYFEAIPKLETIAGGLGVSLSQMALAWCLKNPHVSCLITGASRPEQITENAAAVDAVDKLTDEVMAAIDEATEAARRA